MAAFKEIICRCPYDFNHMRTVHDANCPVVMTDQNAMVRALEISAQIEGEPIFVDIRTPFEKGLSELINSHSMEHNTPDFLLAEFLEIVRHAFTNITDKRDRWKNDNAIVANFGFYVDGFTLHSTDNVEEIRVVAFDGRETTFPTKQLVAFLDRRLSPPNIMPEN